MDFQKYVDVVNREGTQYQPPKPLNIQDLLGAVGTGLAGAQQTQAQLIANVRQSAAAEAAAEHERLMKAMEQKAKDEAAQALENTKQTGANARTAATLADTRPRGAYRYDVKKGQWVKDASVSYSYSESRTPKDDKNKMAEWEAKALAANSMPGYAATTLIADKRLGEVKDKPSAAATILANDLGNIAGAVTMQGMSIDQARKLIDAKVVNYLSRRGKINSSPAYPEMRDALTFRLYGDLDAVVRKAVPAAANMGGGTLNPPIPQLPSAESDEDVDGEADAIRAELIARGIDPDIQ